MFLSVKSRKRFIKAVFWVLTIALGAGLIGSSVVWTSLPKEPVREAAYGEKDPVGSQIAKALERKDVAALLSVGGQCADGGDVEHAVEAYQKVLSIAPDNTAARLGLVEQYFMTSNYKDALVQVDAILQKAPNHQKALYYRGLIRGYGNKDYTGAVADLKRFVALAKTGREVEEAQELIKSWSTKN